MKNIWKHPWTVAACNIVLVLVLYSLLRIVCYLVNGAMFPDIDSRHLLEILLGGVRFDMTAVFYLSSLYVLAILLPLPPRWRENRVYQNVIAWLFIVPNAIGLIINTIDIVYIRFTDRRTTCTFFTEFANDNNLWSIFGQGVVQYWYVTLAGLAVLAILYFCTRKRFACCSVRPIVYYLCETVILLTSVYFYVIGIRGGFGKYTRPITVSNALQYTNTPRESALVLNTPFSLMKSLENQNYVEPPYFSAEELPEHMSPVHTASEMLAGEADSTNSVQNVVVLILESFSREYIGFYNRDREGYEGYTPFLDSLLEQSVTYEYSYASGRKSIDAMPSVLSSIPMLIEPYIVTPYSTNAVSSIADCLKRKGYNTAFFHGAPNGSMGFQAYARSAGFDHYYGMDEFDDKSAFDGTWAIWDEPFLQYYAQTMSRMQEPFMTAVFTASSHHPFKVPEQYGDSFPQGKLPIHASIGYADHALRRFFETASRQPWFEHTLFAITADHTNELSFPEYTNARGLFEVPVAFYHHAIKPEKRPDVVSQTDIMPSILDYIGYREPFFAFGENALTAAKVHPYAVCYNAPLYQVFSDSLLVQYDGERVVGVYDYRHDRCLHSNIAEQIHYDSIAPMVDYLKAYIQQYIHRMIHDELTVCAESVSE